MKLLPYIITGEGKKVIAEESTNIILLRINADTITDDNIEVVYTYLNVLKTTNASIIGIKRGIYALKLIPAPTVNG
jgi:hypothetical protein